MDEPGRVGGPLIRPLSYYLQSPSPQVHLPPPAEFASRGRFRVPSYNHNSTEKLLLEADLLFNELQASSSSSDPSSPISYHVPSATRLLTKTRDPLPNAAAAASEPVATTKTKARKPAEATVTSTAAAPTKRQRVEQRAEDERYERVEVSELEQASAGQIAELSRDSDSDSDKKKKKKTKERKSRAAEKNTKKDEKEKAKGKRARRSADEARQEDEEEEEEQPKRRRRIRQTGDKKAGQARPTTSSDGRWKTGKYVCAEHFRDKCATCKERTPVYLKYGITFAVNNGRIFVCLHPRRDCPNEPCGVRFTTQHELVEHRLAHEASERPGGMVRQEVLDRRLEVSAAVVQRMMQELDESPSSSKSKSPSESTVLIAALIDRECARLGYEEKCKPSAEVVHQRYRWARYRQLKFDSAEELLSEHMRLQRRLQLKMMETLMREDIPLADLDQGWVVARIAHLWDQVKDQRRGIPYTKSTIVGTVYNWARRTYSKPVPPIFPPINRPKKRKRKAKKRRRKEEKRKEKMNKKEEEEEVQSQSDDSYNGNDNEDSEDTAVNDDPDNNNINYDEDTEDEGLATGMEVNEAEEEGEEEEKKKQNESATNSRSRGGDVGGREAVAAVAAARSPPAPPSAVGKAKTTNAHEGLTGRELVLARRRHVMQTLDLLLASQLDE